MGALIGAGAALLGQFAQTRHEARSDTRNDHLRAVEEVLLASQTVDLQAHSAMLLAANLGSFAGLISRMLGNVAPIDLQEVFDRMNSEASSLTHAANRVWLTGDQQTIALTNTVALAAMDVVSAHHTSKASRVRRMLQIAFLGNLATDPVVVAGARSRLSEARRALLLHARDVLEIPVVNPYLEASPESSLDLRRRESVKESL